MDLLTIVRVVAIVCAGLKAGILLGYRAGPQHALPKLSASSLVQFQQVVHVHYFRFMPPLTLTALLTVIAWLVMIRSRWTSAEFWLIAVSACGIALIARDHLSCKRPSQQSAHDMERRAPPSDLRKMWGPWDRGNTIRAFVSAGVLIFEAATLRLRASSRL